MSQEDERHPRRDGEADDVERDLDLGIAHAEDLREFAREQVGRDDRQVAAVGKDDAEGDEEVTDGEVEDAPPKGVRQDTDP